MERAARVVRRCFSSPIPSFLQNLSKELAYETERHFVSEQITVPSTQTFLSRSGYTLTDTANSTQVTLRKDVSGSEVVITFQARPHLPEDLHGSDSSEHGNSPMHTLPFQVTVALPPQGLVFECSAMKTEWNIESVAFARDLGKWEKRTNVMSGEQYRGPEVKEGPMKEEMVRYLEFYGVSPALVSFLKAYAKDKEQRLYIHWLHETFDFFSPRPA